MAADVRISSSPVQRYEGSTPTSAVRKSGPDRARSSFEAARRAAFVPLQRGSLDRPGDRRVLAVQELLVAHNFLSRADLNTGRGIFGPRTEAAVKAFQKRLAEVNPNDCPPVTGKVDEATYKALISSVLRLREQTTDEFPKPLDLDPEVTQPTLPAITTE